MLVEGIKAFHGVEEVIKRCQRHSQLTLVLSVCDNLLAVNRKVSPFEVNPEFCSVLDDLDGLLVDVIHLLTCFRV